MGDDARKGWAKAVALRSARAAADEVESFSDALKNGTLFAWLRGFVARQCWAWAILGSLVLGLTLPVLLVMWNSQGQPGGVQMNVPAPGAQNPPSVVEFFAGAASLLFIALIFCGPLAVLFALSVYAVLRVHAQRPEMTIDRLAKRGALIAGAVAFLNLPGYLAAALMPETGVPLWVRLPLLFIVAGVSCGLWIAWQAWRATRPGEPVLPQYSLSWLMLVVIAWGAVMAVFAPK